MHIETIAQAYAQEMLKAFNFKIGCDPKTKLDQLQAALRLNTADIQIQYKVTTKKGRKATRYHHHSGDSRQEFADYVRAIYDCYDRLNDLKPTEYHSVERLIEPKLGTTAIDKVCVKLPGKKRQSLADAIIDAMRYDAVQSKVFSKYVRQLGIKTCVYCNAQFALTAVIPKLKTNKKGMTSVKYEEGTFYELDHNIAKSKEPYLCTNFYNLQPCCGSCNRRKNDRPLAFSLYYESGDGTVIRPLRFALTPQDLIKYRTAHQCDGIYAHLYNNGDANLPKDDDKSLASAFNTMFGIKGVYEEQADSVLELLWRHKIYSKGMVQSMGKQMAALGIKDFNFNHYILGTYPDSADVHKRPLSMMLQDLWEQLNKI